MEQFVPWHSWGDVFREHPTINLRMLVVSDPRFPRMYSEEVIPMSTILVRSLSFWYPSKRTKKASRSVIAKMPPIPLPDPFRSSRTQRWSS
jgi:hypothetical protein